MFIFLPLLWALSKLKASVVVVFGCMATLENARKFTFCPVIVHMFINWPGCFKPSSAIQCQCPKRFHTERDEFGLMVSTQTSCFHLFVSPLLCTARPFLFDVQSKTKLIPKTVVSLDGCVNNFSYFGHLPVRMSNLVRTRIYKSNVWEHFSLLQTTCEVYVIKLHRGKSTREQPFLDRFGTLMWQRKTSQPPKSSFAGSGDPFPNSNSNTVSSWNGGQFSYDPACTGYTRKSFLLISQKHDGAIGPKQLNGRNGLNQKLPASGWGLFLCWSSHIQELRKSDQSFPSFGQSCVWPMIHLPDQSLTMVEKRDIILSIWKRQINANVAMAVRLEMNETTSCGHISLNPRSTTGAHLWGEGIFGVEREMVCGKKVILTLGTFQNELN